MQPNDCGYRWRSPIPINTNIGRLIMNAYHFTIAVLLAAQAATLAILCGTYREYIWFREAWTKDSWELLHWKRNGIMRDKRTGRYHKKGES